VPKPDVRRYAFEQKCGKLASAMTPALRSGP
jgi:hypothetical protein